MIDEIFEICNENNEVIATAPRSEAHAKGLFHRGAHGFLINSEGNIFLQKNLKQRTHHLVLWGMSVGEHCKPKETNYETIKRGMTEELGITNAEIKLLRIPKLLHIEHENGAIDNEFDALFIIETDKKPEINKEEIGEGRFFTREKIEKNIHEGRMKFTPQFLIEWEYFKERNYGNDPA